ncbi:MAG: dehydrogenase, partial [Deltaproteobacteria bacterium]|nr:dehydrogenase [Deltaproteobacteria bacterium]
MKQIISISLGTSKNDYEFETEFLGQEFNIKRFGTDGDMDKAAEMLFEWDKEADAIGLGNVKFPYGIGPRYLAKKHTDKINKLGAQIQTPVTTGSALRDVSFEWCLRFVEHKFGDYFKNSKVLFLSGMTSFKIAKVMSEYTDNLTFADPIIENGISKFINSIKDLKLYARGAHEILQWVPSNRLASSAAPIKSWNEYILSKAMQKANIIVVPYSGFFDHFKDAALEELGGKIIITSTAYNDRVEFLKERGVDVIIDTTPKILERVVGPNVLEAL